MTWYWWVLIIVAIVLVLGWFMTRRNTTSRGF